ncbi:MAG: tripartite tricarboxylate transporter substrate binding protein [Betaproteobacteria bacterium]|nr:tripartite tricarboxylate transporter substrate binding protein [Betaproteobacteria bacterium]
MKIRHALVCSFAAAAIAATTLPARAAESYPNRPLRLVVPTGAGGNTDTFARVIAEKLKAPLGQQVIVDNRTGASGIIGSDIVAKAAPDGYTLLMVFPSHPVNPSLYSDLPYDTLKDFAPITMITSVTQVLLVNPKVPVNSVKELIAQVKEKPGQFNHGVVGRGSLGDLCAEVFSTMSGARLTQIAYKGAPQVMTALIGGELQVYFSPPVVAMPQMKAGRVRAIGVSTKNRLAVIPEVPTIAESGLPGFEVVGWNGILAPAKTPRALIDRLHADLVKIIRSPEVSADIVAQGIEPIGNTPEEFGKIIRDDVAKWAKVLIGAKSKAN